MRFLVLLFLALFPAEPSHAQEAPNLAFVSEYIAVNERMRALGQRALTDVGGNNQFAALIRSSTRIRMELGAQIHTLSGIQLKPPFEDLTAKITKFYNMKIEFHQRLIAISTSLLSRPQPGVDYGGLAAEIPKITASLEYIDRSLLEATPIGRRRKRARRRRRLVGHPESERRADGSALEQVNRFPAIALSRTIRQLSMVTRGCPE